MFFVNYYFPLFLFFFFFFFFCFCVCCCCRLLLLLPLLQLPPPPPPRPLLPLLLLLLLLPLMALPRRCSVSVLLSSAAQSRHTGKQSQTKPTIKQAQRQRLVPG